MKRASNSMKKLFGSSKKNVVTVQGSANAATPVAQPTTAAAEPPPPAPPPPAEPPAAPPSPAPTASAPAPPPAPPAPPPEEAAEEKQYELEVPPNTMPGMKLKLTIPGMTEKVVITVPDGAVPGSTISFSLPKSATSKTKEAAAAGAIQVEVENKAAILIQARVRGKSIRANMTKLALEKAPPAAAAAEPPAAGGEPAPVEYVASEVFAPLAPALVQDTGAELPAEVDDDDDAAAATAAPPPSPAAGWSLGGALKRSLTNVLGAFQPPTAMPATGVEAAFAGEITRVCAAAIEAWEQGDFDAFAALALPGVAVALPGVLSDGMQGVWQARLEEGTLEGILALDTVMVQPDGDDGATLVGMVHTHDTQTSGMVVKHSWVNVSLRLAAPTNGHGEGGAAWKLAELTFDPIWPKPSELDGEAAPDEFRLGMGRTLRLCTDVASRAAVLFTAWLAGDRNRFDAIADDGLRVSIKALDIAAEGAAAAYDCRAKLLEYGTLLAFNSPMVDAESEPDKIRVLAHAHLYDTADDDAFGQPTCHLAVGLTFSAADAGCMLKELVSDVIWMGEGLTPDTEGLSFESPPLNSVYTRAVTFVKAWETASEDGLASLTTPDVVLQVPRFDVSETGHAALLAYRESLGVLGMLTVDSVRVTGTRFEANVHEYGIDAGQHGLPHMHAGWKLDFEPQRDGSVLVSRAFMDVEFVRQNRRSSVFAISDPAEEVTLAAEL